MLRQAGVILLQSLQLRDSAEFTEAAKQREGQSEQPSWADKLTGPNLWLLAGGTAAVCCWRTAAVCCCTSDVCCWRTSAVCCWRTSAVCCCTSDVCCCSVVPVCAMWYCRAVLPLRTTVCCDAAVLYAVLQCCYGGTAVCCVMLPSRRWRMVLFGLGVLRDQYLNADNHSRYFRYNF